MKAYAMAALAVFSASAFAGSNPAENSGADVIHYDYTVTKGDETLITGSVTTTNRIQVPVEQFNERTYDASITKKHSASGTTVIPHQATVKTGLSMVLTPFADNGSVMTQLDLTFSDLTAMRKFQDIELPEIKKVVTQQSWYMKSGETRATDLCVPGDDCKTQGYRFTLRATIEHDVKAVKP